MSIPSQQSHSSIFRPFTSIMHKHHLQNRSFPAKKKRCFDSATMRPNDMLWNKKCCTPRTTTVLPDIQLPSFTPLSPISVGPNVDAESWGIRHRGSSIDTTSAQWTPKHFVVEVSIGQGHFGAIARASIRSTGAIVALKMMHKNKSDLELVRREINIHSQYVHHHVIASFDRHWCGFHSSLDNLLF